MSTRAKEIYDEVMKDECPSNALHVWADANLDEDSIDNDFGADKTTYVFEDGSKIVDCNGYLEVVGDE